MEKTILGMQEKLAVLNKSVSDEGKQQLAKLEQEVDRLNKEVCSSCFLVLEWNQLVCFMH
jgi:hypothetical protein